MILRRMQTERGLDRSRPGHYPGTGESCADAHPTTARGGRLIDDTKRLTEGTTSRRNPLARGSSLRFPLLFLGLSLIQLGLLAGPLSASVRPTICEWVALHSGWLLGLFGEGVRSYGTVVSAPARGYSYQVIYACTPVSSSVLLISAVCAFPAAWRRKLIGVAVGVAALYVINLLRLVMLFYCHIYWPDLYDLMHYSVWQSLLVVIAVVLFYLWARWSMRDGREVDGAS